MVNRGIEKETVPYCIGNHLSILAYSPMERGLLTGKIRPGHQFAEGDHRAGLNSFSDGNISRVDGFLEMIKPLAQAKKASLSQLVLRWTIEQPGITIALAGARNAEQSILNAKAADVRLSKEEVDSITSELNKLVLTRKEAPALK
jgi:aryl-alcohol dehydrogenase-like predicted oxidoreductase